VLWVAALVATPACGGDAEQVNPLAGAGSGGHAPVDAATTGSSGGAGGGSGGAAPVRRTVEQRNPFGDVAAHDNLLWDGDFEWSSPFSDQYGWVNLPAQPGFAGIRVGIDCRSGLKCAAIEKKQAIAGISVSSQTSKLSVGLWVKPPQPSCDGIQ